MEATVCYDDGMKVEGGQTAMTRDDAAKAAKDWLNTSLTDLGFADAPVRNRAEAFEVFMVEFAWKQVQLAVAARDAEIAKLKYELELAIAHDRQPYPTAHAYEQVCKTLAERDKEIPELRESVAYHTAREEMHSQMRQDMHVEAIKLTREKLELEAHLQRAREALEEIRTKAYQHGPLAHFYWLPDSIDKALRELGGGHAV